jgi:hypothetical protein
MAFDAAARSAHHCMLIDLGLPWVINTVTHWLRLPRAFF